MLKRMEDQCAGRDASWQVVRTPSQLLRHPASSWEWTTEQAVYDGVLQGGVEGLEIQRGMSTQNPNPFGLGRRGTMFHLSVW